MPRRAKDDPRDTRTAIIEAAMRGFGERGFAATGIREIAALAGTNVASISYHFGGKEGLRAACAEHIVKVMAEVLAAASAGDAPPESPEAAERTLAALVQSMVHFLLLDPHARLVAGFILREMAEPSPALDIIYEGLFEGVHRRVCEIWGVATGAAPGSEAVGLAVFAAIGQVVYFHVGRLVVQRRMDWPAIGPAEARAIAETVVQNLAARLAADRSRAP